jgi:hypothetical protein
MDETTLIGRLGALKPPDTDLARERAIETVPARVRAARSGKPCRPRRFSPRLVTAAASVLVALVAFSLLTAPGHAFTSWVGDRLGLGQPGGHPTLQSLRHHAMQGTSGAGQPAYVLLRGPGPLGGHYEFITYRTKPEPGKEFPANGARCFQLEFPEARNLFSAGCGLPPASSGLLYGGVGGNSGPGTAYQFASGRVSDDVAAVDFEVDGRAIPVELRPIPTDLIERLHIRRPFRFFIAFLDGDLRSGTVTVTARDSAGHPVARRTSTLLGSALIQP